MFDFSTALSYELRPHNHHNRARPSIRGPS